MSIYVNIKKKLPGFKLQVQLEAENEILGLLGSSGCGKSMTLRCIAGIIEPDEGEIILDDKILFSSPKKINLPPQKRNIGLMFQNYALFPHMTVSENLTIAIGADIKKKEKLIQDYIEIMRLQDLLDRRPSQLSGGQQQRVALARVLVKEPAILMLDEPFSALDTQLRYTIEKEFSSALRAFSGSILFVSHAIEEVYKYCSRVAVMEEGKIVEIGETRRIFLHPGTLAAANLTGCKNISPLQKLDDNSFLSVNWHLTLPIINEHEQEAKFLGIRETDIQLSATPTDKNCFEVIVKDLQYVPTGILVFLTKKDVKGKECLICFLNNKKAHELLICQKKQEQLFATIDPQNYLYLR